MSKFYTRVDPMGDELLVRGYENGKSFKKKVRYKPYLFVPSRAGSKYRTIEGREVGKVDFDSIKAAREFMNQYKDSANTPVYGMNKFQYMYIYDEFKGDIQYDPSLVSVVTIDIEVDIANDKGFPDIRQADNEITLITISRHGKKAVFGCQPFINNDPENITYYQCKDEAALLRSFLDMWNSNEYSPEIVTGWNVEKFDMPYTINRIVRVLSENAAKKLSPWGFIRSREVPDVMSKDGSTNQVWDITGVTVLDYMQLYKKFAYTLQESYSLDYVCEQELGEKKIDYKDAGYDSLADLQVRNWQLYTEYNIRDVALVDKLDDKLKLIELVYAMAYDAKVNYIDTFTTVGLWDVIIHNYLLDRNIVIHQLKVTKSDRSIMGGYVKDPQVGQHKWVVSLDLNSLYPHIIMQYNISPESYRGRFPGSYDVDKLLDGYLNDHQEYLKSNNLTVTANMCQFSRDKAGFLPSIMKKMYDDRVVYKNQMIEAKKQYEATKDNQLTKDIARLNNLQMAKKIQLNSGYGALANAYNRWYEADFAEAITSSGQLTTRWIEGKLNVFLNKTFKTEDVDYVIACDTDSVYIKADKFIELAGKEMNKKQEAEYLDKVCVKVLEPYIDKCYQELADYMNAFDQKMKMKRECIADKGIWTAKKRYILNVYNQEGVPYEKPKLKMMGIEAIRTSTPAVCRESIKDTLEIIMNKSEEDMQKFVSDFREEFMNMPFELVASPRSVSEIDKYLDKGQIFKKGTPINAKGAIMYNYMIKKLKLDKKYEAITNGQKIKYSYLKMPNPIACNVIASPGSLPAEFNLDKYLDRATQFEKSYLEPIKTIVEAIGWKAEKTYTLEDLWA